MKCEAIGGPLCRHCQRPLAADEERECSRPEYAGCHDPVGVPQSASLTDDEARQIFGELDGPTLLGNRIAAVTSAIGLPPCGGCETRKVWINRAHQWWRENLSRHFGK